MIELVIIAFGIAFGFLCLLIFYLILSIIMIMIGIKIGDMNEEYYNYSDQLNQLGFKESANLIKLRIFYKRTILHFIYRKFKWFVDAFNKYIFQDETISDIYDDY